MAELLVHRGGTNRGYATATVPDPSDEYHYLVEGDKPPQGTGQRTCVCGWKAISGCGPCLNQAYVSHVDRERAARADAANTYLDIA